MHHGLLTVTRQPYGALRLADIPPALRTLIAPSATTHKNLTHTLTPTHGPIPLDLVPWALSHYATTSSSNGSEETPSQSSGGSTTPVQPHDSTTETLTPLNTSADPSTETLTPLGALQLTEAASHAASSVDTHKTTKLDATVLSPHTHAALPLENTAVETRHITKLDNGTIETHAVTGPIKFFTRDQETCVDKRVSLNIRETENTVDETLKQPQPLHADLPGVYHHKPVEEKVPHTSCAHYIDQKIELNSPDPIATNICMDDGAVVPQKSTVTLAETHTELRPHILETTDTLAWIIGTVEVKDTTEELDGRAYVPHNPATELPHICVTERITPLEDTVLIDPYYLTDVTGYSLLPGLFFDDTMDLHTAGRDIAPVDETKAWTVKSYSEQIEEDFTLIDIDPRRETPDFSLHDLV